MVEPASIIGVIGTIIILGSLFLLLTKKKKVPLVIPLLILGIILGPVTGLFNPNSFSQIVNVVVSFALVVVIFEAGSNIDIEAIKKQFLVFISLSMLGPILIICLVSLFSFVVLNLSVELSILLGALLASTDPTILQPILRKSRSKLKSIINLESTVNSVIAVVLVISLTNLLSLHGKTTLLETAKMFFYQAFIGIGVGVSFGYVVYKVVDKVRGEIKPHLLTLGAILLLYAITNALGGSGIVAVLVLGVMFASFKPAPPKIIKSFGGDLEILLIIFVYVILGAFMDVHLSLMYAGVIIAIILLILFARYSSVLVSAFVKNKTERKVLFLGGGKGVVCAVLALSSASLFPNPELILSIIFSVILVTTVLSSLVPYYLKKL